VPPTNSSAKFWIFDTSNKSSQSSAAMITRATFPQSSDLHQLQTICYYYCSKTSPLCRTKEKISCRTKAVGAKLVGFDDGMSFYIDAFNKLQDIVFIQVHFYSSQ
jgi:hypothetical protein